VALGVSRLLPKFLQFLVRGKVERLYKYAELTVRDAQHAVLSLGYTAEDLVKNCPKAPEVDEQDPTIRRLKAVLTHPIGKKRSLVPLHLYQTLHKFACIILHYFPCITGDYAVQPREATFAAHGVTAAHYFNGGAYTVGATQNISTRLTSMCRSFGGEALIDATVRSVIVENGRAVGVRVSNTDELEECSSDEDLAKVQVVEIRAKNIVCATSVYNLYHKFLPQDLPIVQKFHDPTQRTVRQSNGHIFLFCKIKGDAEEIGLPDHNLWYFNGYDLDSAFDKYFTNPREHRPPTGMCNFALNLCCRQRPLRLTFFTHLSFSIHWIPVVCNCAMKLCCEHSLRPTSSSHCLFSFLQH